MPASAAPHATSEPLGLFWREDAAPSAHPDLRQLRFDYASAGDRVPGRLLLPRDGPGPFPVVLLQHGADGSKDAPYIEAVAAPWVRGGVAALCIDFPLHGERASAKLSERLRRVLVAGGGDAEGARLLEAFARQAVADLGRALDAAAALPGLDPRRSAYAGLSLGSMLGALFCAADPRPRAAALALGGGGLGGPALDPAAHVGRIAPRPILFVNATRDEIVPRAAAEALHDAAGEPKEVLWVDAGHRDLPGKALAAMWRFLSHHLDV